MPEGRQRTTSKAGNQFKGRTHDSGSEEPPHGDEDDEAAGASARINEFIETSCRNLRQLILQSVRKSMTHPPSSKLPENMNCEDGLKRSPGGNGDDLVVLGVVLNKEQKNNDEILNAIERLRKNGVTCAFFTMDDKRLGGPKVDSKLGHGYVNGVVSHSPHSNSNFSSPSQISAIIDKSGLNNIHVNAKEPPTPPPSKKQVLPKVEASPELVADDPIPPSKLLFTPNAHAVPESAHQSEVCQRSERPELVKVKVKAHKGSVSDVKVGPEGKRIRKRTRARARVWRPRKRRRKVGNKLQDSKNQNQQNSNRPVDLSLLKKSARPESNGKILREDPVETPKVLTESPKPPGESVYEVSGKEVAANAIATPPEAESNLQGPPPPELSPQLTSPLPKKKSKSKVKGRRKVILNGVAKIQIHPVGKVKNKKASSRSRGSRASRARAALTRSKTLIKRQKQAELAETFEESLAKFCLGDRATKSVAAERIKRCLISPQQFQQPKVKTANPAPAVMAVTADVNAITSLTSESGLSPLSPAPAALPNGIATTNAEIVPKKATRRFSPNGGVEVGVDGAAPTNGKGASTTPKIGRKGKDDAKRVRKWPTNVNATSEKINGSLAPLSLLLPSPSPSPSPASSTSKEALAKLELENHLKIYEFEGSPPPSPVCASPPRVIVELVEHFPNRGKRQRRISMSPDIVSFTAPPPKPKVTPKAKPKIGSKVELVEIDVETAEAQLHPPSSSEVNVKPVVAIEPTINGLAHSLGLVSVTPALPSPPPALPQQKSEQVGGEVDEIDHLLLEDVQEVLRSLVDKVVLQNASKTDDALKPSGVPAIKVSEDSLPDSDVMQLRRCTSFYSLIAGNVRTNLENYLDGINKSSGDLKRRRRVVKNGFLLHHGDNCPEDPESPYKFHLATQVLLKLNRRRAKSSTKEERTKNIFSYLKLVPKRSNRSGKHQHSKAPDTEKEKAEAESKSTFSGDWTIPRKYICGVCSAVEHSFWDMVMHKGEIHPGVVVTHVELPDAQTPPQSLIRKGPPPPETPLSGDTKEDPSASQERQACSKCSETFNTLSDLHRHIFECAGNASWLVEKVTCKRKSRRRRGFKRRFSNTPRKPKKVETSTKKVPLLKCEFCMKEFKTEGWLKNHVYTTHSLPVSIPLDKLPTPLPLVSVPTTTPSRSSLKVKVKAPPAPQPPPPLPLTPTRACFRKCKAIVS